MDTPFLRVEDSGEVISLRGEVTTVGRGRGVDIHLDDPSVSRLHAELIRRGPYVYVVDSVYHATAPGLTAVPSPAASWTKATC